MITILITILILLLVIVIWLLMVPVSIVINTGSHEYRIQQPGTFRFRILSGRRIRGDLAILGIRIPLGRRAKMDKVKTVKEVKKQRTKRRPQEWIGLMRPMLRAFHIRRFNLDIDTGDVVTNAQLIPLFLLVSRPPLHVVTNFEGKVLVDIDISLHIYKAVLAFLRFKLKI